MVHLWNHCGGLQRFLLPYFAACLPLPISYVSLSSKTLDSYQRDLNPKDPWVLQSPWEKSPPKTEKGKERKDFKEGNVPSVRVSSSARPRHVKCCVASSLLFGKRMILCVCHVRTFNWFQSRCRITPNKLLMNGNKEFQMTNGVDPRNRGYKREQRKRGKIASN